MNIAIACEGSPIFTATRVYGSPPEVTFETAQAIIEWFNSLTNPDQDKAYFQEESRLFVFPQEDQEWVEFEPNERGLYHFTLGFDIVPACLGCLCYLPCDCEFDVLNEDQLQLIEEAAVMGRTAPITTVRSLIYTIRELEAQLKVEQEAK